MSLKTIRLSALAVAAALALAACGQGGPPQEPEPDGFSPNFEVVDPEATAPLAVSLMLATPDVGVLGSTFAVEPGDAAGPGGLDLDSAMAALGSSLHGVDAGASAPPVGPHAVEIEAGVWVVATGLVDLEGNFELTFPEPADLPAALLSDWLVPAETFLVGSPLPAGCDVVVSDPGVRISAHLSEIVITLPGLFVVLDGELVAPIVLTTAELDPDSPIEPQEPVFVTWLYADGDVSVSSEGAACDTATTVFGVDLELQTGWNQVGWAVSGSGEAGDPYVLTLIDVDDDATVYMTFLGIIL